MPRPNPGESEQAYIGRFMASAEAQKDFPDEKQRAAVAYSMFKEKKNDLYLCADCGAEMETGRVSERIRQCGACGGQVVDATPPTESIRNLCPHCRHQMEPEHDDLGCHAEGCSCTETPAMALALGNAGDREPAHPPKFKAGDKVRAEGYGFDMLVTGHRVLDTGPGTDMHHYTLKDPTSGQTTEKPEGSLRRAENANGDAARICKPCLDAVVRSGGALSGKETYPDKGGLNHIVTKHGPGHVETACGSEPCCENTNAKPVNHAWHAAKDAWYDHYNDCETCQREDGPGGGYCTRGSALYQTFKSEDAKALGNTDTCQKCASGAFFSSYKDHEKACAQCGGATSEGALCAEGRKLYDAMEHDHLTHEARNRKETVAEAFARLKLEAEKWWDEKGQPDRELALKRAGLPADTEAVKLGWAALPAATRKAVIEAMNDGYRHEVNNALSQDQIKAKISEWDAFLAKPSITPEERQYAEKVRKSLAADLEKTNAACQHPQNKRGGHIEWSGEWLRQGVNMPDAMKGQCACGVTVMQERGNPHNDDMKPRENAADPKADQAAMIAVKLRDILKAHGSAMVYKRGSSVPLDVKSEAQAGDLSQIEAVEVPQDVKNSSSFRIGQEVRHRKTGWRGRVKDLHPFKAGEEDTVEVQWTRESYPPVGAITPEDPADLELMNARGSDLAKKLGVAHPKDLPFDQINEHGCNGCDDIRAPLNADGYCKDCAKEQGAFVNAEPPTEPVSVGHGWDGGTGKPGKTFKIPPPPEKKNAGPGFPVSHFKRPESKDRADQVGIEDMEDEDLTPAGLKAKREALAEIGGLDNAVSGIHHVGADQRQADGEAVYGSAK